MRGPTVSKKFEPPCTIYKPSCGEEVGGLIQHGVVHEVPDIGYTNGKREREHIPGPDKKILIPDGRASGNHSRSKWVPLKPSYDGGAAGCFEKPLKVRAKSLFVERPHTDVPSSQAAIIMIVSSIGSWCFPFVAPRRQSTTGFSNMIIP